jgi:lipooligosaccharide transport system ATP-binding protein
MDAGRIIVQGSPRELIAQHIEPHVVEIFGDAGDTQSIEWARSEAGRYAHRCEMTGETLFCYVDEPAELLGHLAARPGLRVLHRPASLEDVFLKLTGRDLRD